VSGGAIAKVAALVALGTMLVSVAYAADGVIEINQSCATQTGCGSGDGPGFPVQTLQGRSYVLTGSLTVADADQSGVSLANGATLDLNGFSITGPAVCAGTPPSCLGVGTGSGVSAGANTTIRNGRIAGMGGDGISGADGTRVEAMLIESNADDGIEGANGSRGWIVRDSRIVANKDRGISLGGASPSAVVTRNAIVDNGGVGVYGTQLVLIENVIFGNASFGWSPSGSSTAYNLLEENNGASAETSGSSVPTGPA